MMVLYRKSRIFKNVQYMYLLYLGTQSHILVYQQLLYYTLKSKCKNCRMTCLQYKHVCDKMWCCSVCIGLESAFNTGTRTVAYSI